MINTKIKQAHISSNMFDRRAEGKIYDSVYTESSGWETHYYMYMTSLIAVKGGETYTWRISADTSSGSSRLTDITTVYYDKDLNEIGCASHADSVRYYSFTVPQNCAYVRCPTSRVENIDRESMLNVGSSPLPYEEYYAPYYDTVSYAKSISGAQTYTKFPIVLRTTEQSIPTWTIKGNTVQNGTPTPSNPVDVNGVGVRTGNLFDKTAAIQGKQYNENGVLVDAESNWYATDYIPVTSGGTYIRSINAYGIGSAYNEYDSQKNFIARYTPTYGTPFTVGENTAYITFSINSTNTNLNDYMFNTGSTAKPYEPYGYKIPIVSGSTTTNIYLSEPLRKIGDYADTIAADGTVTRRIKKLVFTGNEDWLQASDYTFYVWIDDYLRIRAVTTMSTHYIGQSNVTSGDFINYGNCCVYYTEGANVLYTKTTTPYSSLQDFKTWLAEQYANDTPVTVYYVLATPTTETITTSAISTTSGLNTIDVQTTLKPSEMSITYDGYNLCKGQRYSRTENLFDSSFTVGYYLNATTGLPDYTDDPRMSTLTPIDVTAFDSVTFSFINERSYDLYVMYSIFDGNTLISRVANQSTPLTIDTSDATKLYLCVYPQDISKPISTNSISNVMLNTGSTAKPYQPYMDWK